MPNATLGHGMITDVERGSVEDYDIEVLILTVKAPDGSAIEYPFTRHTFALVDGVLEGTWETLTAEGAIGTQVPMLRRPMRGWALHVPGSLLFRASWMFGLGRWLSAHEVLQPDYDGAMRMPLTTSLLVATPLIGGWVIGVLLSVLPVWSLGVCIGVLLVIVQSAGIRGKVLDSRRATAPSSGESPT